MVGKFWRKQWPWAKVVLRGAARMWGYLNSPDLNSLSVKWVVCYLHHRTEWNGMLSRPGTESWHRQPPSMVRADGGLAPPSSLALGSHSQPPTQSAGKGHIGAALGGQA